MRRWKWASRLHMHTSDMYIYIYILDCIIQYDISFYINIYVYNMAAGRCERYIFSILDLSGMWQPLPFSIVMC